MATRILKGQPLPHIVICDTNILWCEDKMPVANSEFEQFWKQASGEFDLQLCIPDTVWGELQFQHNASCIKQLKNIEESHKKISNVVAASHMTSLTASQLKAQITAKFDKWSKDKRANIVSLPIDKINWQEIAQDAIWRNGPFTPDAKNPDAEKGFRDALILETLVDLVQSNKGQINFAFICNDSILRLSAACRLKDDKRFSIFESLKDFESYLRLSKEELTKEFIEKIRTRASEKFFKSDDETSLWYREKLLERIQKEFKPYYDNVSKSESLPFYLSGSLGDYEGWSASGNGSHWINLAEFLRIETGKRYFWRTRVLFARLYTRTGENLTVLTGSWDTKRLLKLPFEFTWSAMVKDDARFHKLKIEGVTLQGNSFGRPTEEEIKEFGLA